MKENCLKIKSLIAYDKIGDAINTLMSISINDKMLTNRIVVLSSKYHEIKNTSNIGLITRDVSATELTKIRYSLLTITDEIEQLENKKDIYQNNQLSANLEKKFQQEYKDVIHVFKSVIESHPDTTKEIEKYHFLYNSLSEKRLEAIKNNRKHLTDDLSVEIMTLLSIIEKNLAKELKSDKVISKITNHNTIKNYFSTNKHLELDLNEKKHVFKDIAFHNISFSVIIGIKIREKRIIQLLGEI